MAIYIEAALAEPGDRRLDTLTLNGDAAADGQRGRGFLPFVCRDYEAALGFQPTYQMTITVPDVLQCEPPS